MMGGASAETFDEHILGIVDNFLQTVVVVDDRAFDGRPERTSEDQETSSRGGRGRAVTGGLKAPSKLDDHDLDPKAVTDAFAEHGLVCSLLSPDADEDVDERVLRAARRADLVVMDWVLHRDEGRKTLDLIEKILVDDEYPHRRRLRTIAVYTGQTGLHEVADRLAATLEGVYRDCPLVRHDDGLAMTKGPVRAAVFAKEHVSDLGPALEPRRVAFSDLPTRLRGEFATLTTGLVTGVALATLAALRDDTHRVLRALGPTLDPGYLGHRSALTDPDDAMSQAVALVASEIRSVVDDNDVGRNVAMPMLSLWLQDAKRNDLKFGELIDGKKRLSLPQVESMLRVGLGTDDGAAEVGEVNYGKKYFKNSVKPQATKVFSSDLEEAIDSDASFAHRMMMRTVYSYPERVLQLGTIVFSSGRYALCVQPLCDSVRLEGATAFPFLALAIVAADGRPNLVVKAHESDGWVYLKLGGKPSELLMVAFQPGNAGSVTAQENDGKHTFTDAAGEKHILVGELKPDFAQKAAFDLASQFGRIAVDEAETFRLSRR
jgi:hypothetical protein